MTPRNVPYFERAPIVERVLGVQFQPIASFHSGLLGAFWKSLGDEWTAANDAAPIAPHFIDFGNERLSLIPRVSLTLTQMPVSRLQILNQRGDRMIQIQNGRFHLNWKGASGKDYPRYPQIREEFDRYFNQLVEFLIRELSVRPSVELWEVTYLNHLPRASVWSEPRDWASLFPPLSQPSVVPNGLSLETIGGSWQYEICPRRGQLQVEIRHGRSERGGEELLVFSLTARGPINRDVDSGIAEGLDLGRLTIVNAFKNLTSETAHTYWGLRDETG